MSELLQKENIGQVERWETPNVSGGKGGGQHLRTVAELEELEKQAYDEGFKQGYEDGKRAGVDAAATNAQKLDGLLKQLNAPFKEMDNLVEQELSELACAIARQVVRRELKTSPDEVIGAVREALALLPVACRNVRLLLHPEDAALVRDALAPADGSTAWQIVEDPMLTRGGCRILTDTSQIDAQVEKRLGAAISAVLGDHRQRDRSSEGDENDDGEP